MSPVMLEIMNDNDKVELQIYVETGCVQCERAVQIGQEVESGYSDLAVNVIDISDEENRPDDVFAVPTFMLNGRVISLGNPQESQLRQEIETLLNARDSV